MNRGWSYHPERNLPAPLPGTSLAAWHHLLTHFQPHLPHHRHSLLPLHHLVVPSAILIFDI